MKSQSENARVSVPTPPTDDKGEMREALEWYVEQPRLHHPDFDSDTRIMRRWLNRQPINATGLVQELRRWVVHFSDGHGAARDLRDAQRVPAPPERAETNLIVEFVVPHYFGSLFDVAPSVGTNDNDGSFGGVVICREHGQIIGDVKVWQNEGTGEWMVDVSNNGERMFSTFIENVERIVVL